MHALTSFISAVLAGQVTAMIFPRQDCGDVLEYQNLVQGAPFDQPPVNAVASTCSAPCSHTNEVSHTEGVETSISVSIGAELNFEDIFSLGVEAGFTEAWSTSDTTTCGTSVDCEGTGYKCGAMVTATVVKINGQARLPPGGLGCPGDNDFHDFEIVAPLQANNAGLDCAGDKAAAVMNFEACVKSCNNGDAPEVCAVANNLRVCPA
ncbi:hypothetical protein K505DRAFT_361701 [Melanomma pulvis-pyrius CBS 109.77]|uniref:Uncharacterized protein n=1 Tax=Melanomma pulvis-pyrius CBS 109.77 TaxID=1314802 RepID=A0A6A6XBB9_9PLEO|nr:hypothetical protein K505DRAFT_361701 [Melanomma pulvis-pyrius CBS 109.77]